MQRVENAAPVSTAHADTIRPMTSLLGWAGDVRMAMRGLWHAKAFSGAAVLTLAIGIGGACLILALVQGVLLRPLPVRDQDRLIVAWNEIRSSGYSHAPFGDAAIATVAETSQQFEAVAGVTTNGVGRWAADRRAHVGMGERRAGHRHASSRCSASCRCSGARSSPRTTSRAPNRSMVISHRLWRGRYASAPDVVGRRLSLGEQSFVIVGVMPPGLDYPRGVEVWRTTGSVPPGATFAHCRPPGGRSRRPFASRRDGGSGHLRAHRPDDPPPGGCARPISRATWCRSCGRSTTSFSAAAGRCS